MIERHLEPILIEAAKKMPVVTVTGPRQSGKSTLVKHTFRQHSYVNLEGIDNRNFALEDPRGFLSTYTSPVIIDEVQYAPDLLSYIQLLVDDGAPAGSYILTGSQNLLLMKAVSQSLAGRTAIFNLLPFSQAELSSSQLRTSDLGERMIKGSYPRIYDQDLDPYKWYTDYISTYVERDVRVLLNIGDLTVFRQFIELCAGRIGQLINFSELGSAIGVSYQTVKRWLSVLETSFILYTVRPYHKNYNKRISKSSKLYFYDIGLAAALLKIKSKEQLQQHFLHGGLFENFVFNEHVKMFLNKGEQPSIYFWRDSTQKEIDLIVDLGVDIYAVEIKSSQTFHSSFLKHLNYFQALAGETLKTSYLIYGGEGKQIRSSTTVLGWKEMGEMEFWSR